MVPRALVLFLLAGTALASSPPWTLTAADQLASQPAVHTVTLPALDVAKARAEDYAGKRFGDPPRVALGVPVDQVVLGTGKADARRWRQLSDGRWVWRLAIDAPNALALDFSFRHLRLPAGAELWIRNADGSDWIGPFSDADNRANGKFFTPMLRGAHAVIELVVPEPRREFVKLELAAVSRYYRDLFSAELEKSGRCNSDSICPTDAEWRNGSFSSNPDPVEALRISDAVRAIVGDEASGRWQPESASVARFTFRRAGGSSFLCTGQLASTTLPERDTSEPTFLTAHHCIKTAAEAESMVLYWGYQSAICRSVGSSENGAPLDPDSHSMATQSGALMLATHQPTDVTVLRLSTPVPSAAQAIATGWDRSENVPTGAVAIHHPAGDEKRISINTDALTLQASCILEDAPSNTTHWRVNNWEQGTTEGGSSGGGLWNPDGRRLIGVLSGGAASCSVIGYDCFGRLAVAWDGGGSAETRLRDWLDPIDSGAEVYDPEDVALIVLSVNSPAFSTLASAGEAIVIAASASGGREPYSYEWDIDGDGVIDRRGSDPQITVSYSRRTSTQLSVRVIDADGVASQINRALDVAGPDIIAEASGEPVQLCGNDDAQLDPGERWQLPVRLHNQGDGALAEGGALFAPGAVIDPISFGPDGFGYAGSTSEQGGCGTTFVDISRGDDAVPALNTFVANGNTFGPQDDARSDTITLGGSGVLLYGQRYSQAVMSTNGYVSFDPNESGGDFSPDCEAGLSSGGSGPQLRPLHDDLRVGGEGDDPPVSAEAGLRYQYFATCPRQSDLGNDEPCHVFQWTDLRSYQSDTGQAEFQAIAYEISGQIAYLYRLADLSGDFPATIGIVNGDGSDLLNLNCPDSPRQFAAAADSAVCLYTPQAGPTAGGTSLALLPQPVQPITALEAGADVEIELPFAVPSDADCGAPVSIAHVASAAHGLHSFALGNVHDGRVASVCQPVASCDLSGPAPDVRAGFYFDPARDTNGINSVLQPRGEGRHTFGALWYTGQADRTPTWYQLNGPVYELGGEVSIYRHTNTAAPDGFAPVGEKVGRAWVGWGADGALTVAWEFDDGRSGAERMTRQELAFAQPNHSSAWFNPAESGWGLAIESLDVGPSAALEFVAAYLYDSTGAPRWVSGALSAQPGFYPLNGYSPQCPGCPRFADVQQQVNNAGSLRIDYLTPHAAELSTDIVMPAPWSGNWDRLLLPIQPIVTPTGATAQ